jgi:hypothetical protein
MGETLNEQCRVSDEGPLDCKTLLLRKKVKIRKWFLIDGTFQESHG